MSKDFRVDHDEKNKWRPRLNGHLNKKRKCLKCDGEFISKNDYRICTECKSKRVFHEDKDEHTFISRR